LTVDPRYAAVDKRLEGVRRIVAVTGGKGGIGKSLIASTLAVVLSRNRHRTGLLDLDLTGPCDHVVLGLDDRFPTEEFGIEPPVLHDIAFMSVAYFAGDNPAPLRGEDITNALLEILAITRWGDLDVLVVDMPPGLGDATLDTIRLMRGVEYLVVATDSQVVLETVRRSLRLLTELRTPIVGVLENMRRRDSDRVRELAEEFKVPFLGSVPFDDAVEEATGDVARLSDTVVARALAGLSDVLVTDHKSD
jgi:ATP-binding protein involved in chromosome partitioning